LLRKRLLFRGKIERANGRRRRRLKADLGRLLGTGPKVQRSCQEGNSNQHAACKKKEQQKRRKQTFSHLFYTKDATEKEDEEEEEGEPFLLS
jgi:hypothetical protein